MEQLNSIAILVTTFLRDDLLDKSIKSMLECMPEYCRIIIGDQNPSLEKLQYYHNRLGCIYEALPFNCGLSKARNILVQRAKLLDYKYVVLASDSFIFNERTKILNSIPALNEFDIIGFHLAGCSAYWVGNLSLIPNKYFELDFYDRSIESNYIKIDQIRILPCNIIHNFFVTKTDILLQTPWDEVLVMAEHEDEFYRLGLAGCKVGWTSDISASKSTTRQGEHGEYRQRNWNLGLQKLKQKYNLQTWVKYKNLNLGKKLDTLQPL